jgi:hypothetical protein
VVAPSPRRSGDRPADRRGNSDDRIYLGRILADLYGRNFVPAEAFVLGGRSPPHRIAAIDGDDGIERPAGRHDHRATPDVRGEPATP